MGFKPSARRMVIYAKVGGYNNLKNVPAPILIDFGPASNLSWGPHFDGLADETCRLNELWIW
jgi:hypothetical protein